MILNPQQEYWNGRYSDERMIWGQECCLAARRAATVFKENHAKKILVPGCGYGRNSLYLALQGFDVSGFDISDEAIKIAQKMVKGKSASVQYIHADLLDVELSHNYDGILSINMLHLYDETNRKRILEIYQKILNPNGVLVLTSMSVNDPDFRKGDMIAYNTYESKKGRPIYYFDQQSMKDLMSKYFTQLVIEEIQEFENHGGKEHFHGMIYVEAEK